MINELRSYIFYTWLNAFSLGMDLIYAVWNIKKEDVIFSAIWIILSVLSFACFEHFRAKYLHTLEFLEIVENKYNKMIEDKVEYV